MNRMNPSTLIALPLALLLAAPGWCAHGKDHNRNRNEDGPRGRPARLELAKWPVYPGATVVRQVNVTGDQVAKMVKGPEGKGLEKLGVVQILGLKLPPDATPERVVSFYESRVLGAGFHLLIKNFEKNDSAAVYTGPGGLLVFSFEPEKDQANPVEIVSVHGDLSDLAGLAKLGDLGEKLGVGPGDAQKPGK